MATIGALYKAGVFKPLEPVDLPDDSRVEMEVRLTLEDEGRRQSRRNVWRILGEEYDSGEPDVSSRHDEHQP